MVCAHGFYFIKDDLIDANIAFTQNVDNVLFCIYFDYQDRCESDINQERNKLLSDLFRNIKSSLMGGRMNLAKEKEMLKEGENLSFLKRLDFNVERPFMYRPVLDKLIDLKFHSLKMNYDEMRVNLILYCILVNGLDKTKGKKFDQIKKEMQPLIKILKEIFCEFDKNEIHKERTFIYPLRSPVGHLGDFYIINQKDMLRYKDDDVKFMFLDEANKDETKNKYYSIVLNHSLYWGEEEEKECKL